MRMKTNTKSPRCAFVGLRNFMFIGKYFSIAHIIFTEDGNLLHSPSTGPATNQYNAHVILSEIKRSLICLIYDMEPKQMMKRFRQ